MPTDPLCFLDLHERHPGLTKALADSYAEATRICLTRRHASPCAFEIEDIEGRRALVEWEAPSERERRAWSNVDDATESGALGLALASIEKTRKLVAVARAHTKTGADYYLASGPHDDLENAVRLEISGVDRGPRSRLTARLQEKIRQAAKGKSNLPAIALVVGFEALLILIADVKQS